MSHRFSFEYEVKKLVSDYSTILEIGSGLGFWGWYLNVEKKGIIIDGIEVYKPYLDIVNNFKIYNHIYNEDALKMDYNIERFGKKFDVILISDVIEHIEFKDSLDLLDKIENICNRIIITTPDGYMYNKANENPFNEHLSGWRKEGFESLGYNVNTYDVATIHQPKIFRKLIAFYNFLLGRTTHKQLIAWKDIK